MVNKMVVEEKKPENIIEFMKDIDKKTRLINGQQIEENEKQLSPIQYAERIYKTINVLCQVDKLGKPKKLNLRRKIKGNIENTFKKESIITIILRRNRDINLKVLKIHNGCILVDSVPRVINKDLVFMMEIGKKHYPTTILPEWDMIPLGTEKWYKENPNGLDLPSITKIIYAYSKSNEIKSSNVAPAAVWIIGGIIGFLVIAFIIAGAFTK